MKAIETENKWLVFALESELDYAVSFGGRYTSKWAENARKRLFAVFGFSDRRSHAIIGSFDTKNEAIEFAAEYGTHIAYSAGRAGNKMPTLSIAVRKNDLDLLYDIGDPEIYEKWLRE